MKANKKKRTIENLKKILPRKPYKTKPNSFHKSKNTYNRKKKHKNKDME